MAVIRLDHFVKRRARRKLLDEQKPPWRAGGVSPRRWIVGDGIGRPKRLVIYGQNDFQRFRPRIVGLDDVTGLPAEDVQQQATQVLDARVAEVGQEGLMLDDDVGVDVSLRLQQRRRRDDEANRLEVAEPLLVGPKFGVFRHVMSSRGSGFQS